MKATMGTLDLFLLLYLVMPGTTQGNGYVELHKDYYTAPQQDVSALVGENAILPCQVDTNACGDLHNIKWYRGQSRIFVFSDSADVSRPEGDYVQRAFIHYDPNSTLTTLEITPLLVEDQAIYKCEITYLEAREGCDLVQFVNLTTLIKPEYVKVTRHDGTEITDGTIEGPFLEGTQLILECESGGGKPIPSVAWWNGSSIIPGDYTTEAAQEGIGTGRNRIQLTLGRGDLGRSYECRATNAALEKPLRSSVRIDVNVRPSKLELKGVETAVVQGSPVTLQCNVAGARPAANVTWFNGTVPISERVSSSVTSQTDSTFLTQSNLTFTATRYENGETITCEAINPVMQEKDEEPLRKTISLKVLYPPIVSVIPENVTVNETTDVLLFCHYEANPMHLVAVRWYQDNQELVLTADRYEGGTVNEPNLLIKNSSRYDQGAYHCVLENDIGKSEPSNEVFVSIFYKPQVKIIMDPPSPVNEVDLQNVTLTCDVVSGNPDLLLVVRWYLDDNLLKELPDCNVSSVGTDALFCDIDPSKLMLQDVTRSFHGNYSCEGQNEAGWGSRSENEELIIYYPPGPATLVYEPSKVIKKNPLTLTCSVEDPGRPETSTFKWIRGTHVVHDITSANWTIDSVTLETQSNFTCLAYNDGGEGEPATVNIEVFAPPLFIERLPPYHGALMNAEHISVSCRVECSPLCDVHWLKNGQPLQNSSHYTIKTTKIPPDLTKSDFESVLSTLFWNMSAWPKGKLDRIADHAEYTCESTPNEVGPGVTSTTIFHVEYPPENITVTPSVVNVTEGNIPEKVTCSAKAYPEAQYHWIREKDDSTIINEGTLTLSGKVGRDDKGYYKCEAYNRHGNITERARLNVWFKPECGITQSDMNGKIVLKCVAFAEPQEVNFTWKVKNENDTIEENIESTRLQSILTLDNRVENYRTYSCYANNSIGMSYPCEIDVTSSINWFDKLGHDKLIYIIVIIVSAILMVLIVCVIIIIVCRRKRAEDKYNNPVEMEERENPEGDSNLPPAQVQPVHKWPLRPGVHVHVNGLHRLGQAGKPIAGFSYGPRAQKSLERSNTDIKTSTPKRETGSTSPINSNAFSDTSTNSRTSRKRRFSSYRSSDTSNSNKNNHPQQHINITPHFSPWNRRDTLPGVFHGKSGVVTFKKIDGTHNNGTSRKRKKPGKDPSPSTIKGKPNQDNMSPNDGNFVLDGDKAFYENLPFHGMQSPPNKIASDLQVHSRPPSQLSRNGSSGYGSTRSHVGPHVSQIFSGPNAAPKKHYGSMRGPKVFSQDINLRQLPQFQSVRLSKDQIPTNSSAMPNTRLQKPHKTFQLHTMPIKENAEGKSIQSAEPSQAKEQNNNNVDHGSNQSESHFKLQSDKEGSRLPPVPAPRAQTSKIKHTYQNVPIPISPNAQEMPKNPPNPLNPKQLNHFATSQSNRTYPSLHQLPPILQQQLQCHQLCTTHGSHRPANPYVTDSIVYADLALPNGSHRQSIMREQTPTEYAVLKFHDVGQEIDV